MFWKLIICQLFLFAIIFSHSGGCLFTLLIVSFVVQKLLSLIRFHFCFHYSRRQIQKILLVCFLLPLKRDKNV